ncbi:putative short-chain dehydrogenase/reductase family protein [Stipitochalara longipes BDJ]|nr:putative short-chain dehydrogenase/reductase family protein [Stipitochalara longipes BDJ]
MTGSPATSPRQFLASHLFLKLPYPTKEFTGQTIIVTGSNIGMGLEAARHFVRLNAAKVILAVRSSSKGLAAKESIEATTKRLNVVEVWDLDLTSYDSVKALAEKVNGLERLDVLIENAGIFKFEREVQEGNEVTITVNVISTFLLALLALPKLRETGVKYNTVPILTFTGSFTHAQAQFPARKAERIFEELNKDDAKLNERYEVSKLIQLLCARELANQLDKSQKSGRIIVSTLNPGFVATAIMREASWPFTWWLAFLKAALARTPEEGGRTLVNAAYGGEETHGQYLDDCKIGTVSSFVTSDEGVETEKRVWAELSEILEKIQPGIMRNI